MNAFRRIPSLDAAWAEKSPTSRLHALRSAGLEAKELLEKDGPVVAVATCGLVTFPYPTRFAFSGGALSPAPYVMMTNRFQVVQYADPEGQLRTLLFNPSDYIAGNKTPFFWNLRKRYGDFLADKVIATYHGTVESHLQRLGLSPEDVDYIAFDHLHVQDVRKWLGTHGSPGFFPRAKLIVQKAEWESVQNLHPFNAPWYPPNGCDGIAPDRLALFDGDAWLGRGVAIVSTPGHTLGNMSLVFVTPSGTFVVSENGVSTESYTPLHSAIPGVRGYAEQFGYEVVLNGNTREHSLDQYNSMILEKTLAGASKVDGKYVNFLPSSELTASVLAPGLAPTFSLGDINFGEIKRPMEQRRASAA